MTSQKGRDGGADKRRQRLAAALRENLKRRKAQQRGRDGAAPSQAGPDQRLGGEQKV